MKKFSRPLKFIIGLLLLPTALLAFIAVGEVAWALVKSWRITLFFLAGIAVYLFCHRFIYRFSRLYVTAHEAVHAAAALICGHKVQSITVGEESGNVKLSGVNTFILLAPYVFPLFAIASIAAYFILNLFVPQLDKRIFILLFGFFTAHHGVHTYTTLTGAEQSDIKMAGGSIFSFSLIVLFNAAIILILLELLFPGVAQVWQAVKNIFVNTIIFWKAAGRWFYNFIVWAGSR